MVYSTRRFVLCLTLCYFVLVFFSLFSIAITSLGEERVNLSAFHTFVRFALVSSSSWCLGGLRFVIVALPGLSSYLFFLCFLAHQSQSSGGAYRIGSCPSSSDVVWHLASGVNIF